LLGAHAVQALVMAATSMALLTASPPALVYFLEAPTAIALTVTHPAYAVVSPGLARTTEQPLGPRRRLHRDRCGR
jgi:hypothetical protein